MALSIPLPFKYATYNIFQECCNVLVLASCSWNLHVLCIYHLKSINLPVIGLCCWSCSARYKAGQQAPAIKEQIYHEKICKAKFRNFTWEEIGGTLNLHSAQLQESSKNANSCRTWRRLWFLWWCRNTEAVLADSESSSDHPIWNQSIPPIRENIQTFWEVS